MRNNHQHETSCYDICAIQQVLIRARTEGTVSSGGAVSTPPPQKAFHQFASLKRGSTLSGSGSYSCKFCHEARDSGKRWARYNHNKQPEGRECEDCRCYVSWSIRGTKEQKKRKKDALEEDNKDEAKKDALDNGA